MRDTSDNVRRVELGRSTGVSVQLTYYSPGVVHEPHRHDLLQISFLLVGGLEESNGKETLDVLGPSIGVKPAGLWHADTYGTGGSLILAVNIDPASLRSLGEVPSSLYRWRWTQDRGRSPSELWTHYETDFARQSGQYALARASGGDAGWWSASGAVPGWLRDVRRVIDATPARPIGEVARRAGVHRVSLARAFHRHFGVSPSEYRRRSRVARAIPACVSASTALRFVALDAGFADQAHLTRETRRVIGVPPSRLRALFAG